jgi:hypothetical protein
MTVNRLELTRRSTLGTPKDSGSFRGIALVPSETPDLPGSNHTGLMATDRAPEESDNRCSGEGAEETAMNTNERVTWFSRAAWMAAALLAVTIPATAFAQCPVALASTPTVAAGSIIGVLNETRERIGINLDQPSPLNQGQFIDGQRIANAVEQGVLLPATGCGTLAGFAGEIKVSATSRIPFNATGSPLPDLGIGPIQGTFTINAVAGRIDGRLTGVLDFVPTNAAVTLCGGPCPFVYTSGKWETVHRRGGDLNKTGSFAGVALVPFQHPVNGAWLYYDPTGILLGTPGKGGYLPLDPAKDVNLDGQPEAKFIVNMFD